MYLGPPTIPASDIAEAKKRYLAGVAALVPECRSAAEELLDRISTLNWSLEWGLGAWLASSLGLAEPCSRDLLLANLYILAFARLTDDLADGECAIEPGAGVILASVLQQLAAGEYLALFQRATDRSGGAVAQGEVFGDHKGDAWRRQTRFWSYFQGYMGQWLAATWANTAEPEVMGAESIGSPQGEPALRLARPASASDKQTALLLQASRGAFLKIGCAAAYLLADREPDLPLLTSAVEHLLVGVVMLDERFDWAEDLAAARDNIFVAHCSELPQTGEHIGPNRQAVLRMIYLGEADSSYFEKLQGHLIEAESRASRAGCSGLRDFVVWYQAEVARCSVWFAQQRRDRLQAAAGSWLEARGA